MVSFKLDHEPRVRRSIAFRASQIGDVQRIAKVESGGNVSFVIQQLVDAEVERRKADGLPPFSDASERDVA